MADSNSYPFCSQHLLVSIAEILKEIYKSQKQVVPEEVLEALCETTTYDIAEEEKTLLKWIKTLKKSASNPTCWRRYLSILIAEGADSQDAAYAIELLCGVDLTIKIEPINLDFGLVYTGQTFSQIIKVEGDNVKINQIPAEITVSLIDRQNSTTRYNIIGCLPKPGAYVGILGLTNENGVISPVKITASCQIGPVISISPKHLNFGAIVINSEPFRGPTSNITIRNTGEATLKGMIRPLPWLSVYPETGFIVAAHTEVVRVVSILGNYPASPSLGISQRFSDCLVIESNSGATEFISGEFEIKNPTASNSRVNLFPVYGVTIGKTSQNELAKLGIQKDITDNNGKPRKYYTVKGIDIWYEYDVANLIYIAKGIHPIPDPWRVIGFNWEKSYTEWMNLLQSIGFSIFVAKQPNVVTYNGHPSFHAEVIASKKEATEYKMDFNFMFSEGVNINSKDTLYSITVSI